MGLPAAARMVIVVAKMLERNGDCRRRCWARLVLAQGGLINSWTDPGGRECSDSGPEEASESGGRAEGQQIRGGRWWSGTGGGGQ